MNIPNVLTVSRLFIAGIIMALLALEFPFAKSLAFLLFVFAGITDYLDGYLARNVYGTSSFGKLMDPLADKVMVCAAYVSFVEIAWSPPTRPWCPPISSSSSFPVNSWSPACVFSPRPRERSSAPANDGQAQDHLADRLHRAHPARPGRARGHPAVDGHPARQVL
ncbi:MAG: CDP-alcohol phosphatidyltransferase family protein [Kiritimatiellia bacterium]